MDDHYFSYITKMREKEKKRKFKTWMDIEHLPKM
jgi:hypothetical protein